MMVVGVLPSHSQYEPYGVDTAVRYTHYDVSECEKVLNPTRKPKQFDLNPGGHA
jgi:hypothetical protein